MSTRTWSFEHLGAAHWTYDEFDGPATLKGPGVEALIEAEDDDSVDVWLKFLVTQGMPETIVSQVHAELKEADFCKHHDNSKCFRVSISSEPETNSWMVDETIVELA